MEQDYTQLAEALRMRDEGKSESEILAHFSGAAKSEIGESLDVVHWIEAESAAMAVPPRASLEKLLAKIEVAAAKPAASMKPSVIAKPVAALSAAAVSTVATAARAAAPAASSLAAALPLSKKAILAKMNSTKAKPSTDSAMKPTVARKQASVISSYEPASAGNQLMVLADQKGWAQFMSNVSWRSFLPVAAVAAVLLLVGVYKGLPNANPGVPSQVAVGPADTASTAPETASGITVAMVSPTGSGAPASSAPAGAAKPAMMKTAALAAPSSVSAANSSKPMTPDQAYSQLSSGSDNEANAVSGSDSDVSDSNSKSFAGLASTYDENTI